MCVSLRRFLVSLIGKEEANEIQVFILRLCCGAFVGLAGASADLPRFDRGNVFDSTGAAVPGVTVQLLENSTGTTSSTVSTSAGVFVFPDLMVGAYTITVTSPGSRLRRSIM